MKTAQQQVVELSKKVDALMNYMKVGLAQCNICQGTGKTTLDYWAKESGHCIECAGTGSIVREVY